MRLSVVKIIFTCVLGLTLASCATSNSVISNSKKNQVVKDFKLKPPAYGKSSVYVVMLSDDSGLFANKVDVTVKGIKEKKLGSIYNKEYVKQSFNPGYYNIMINDGDEKDNVIVDLKADKNYIFHVFYSNKFDKRPYVRLASNLDGKFYLINSSEINVEKRNKK